LRIADCGLRIKKINPQSAIRNPQSQRMRQRFYIIGFIVVVLLLLVLLNAASYVRLEQKVDYEINPDRSTYNASGSGTRALYDYLQETGHKVIRWQQTPAALIKTSGEKPNTFVVVGITKREFESEEVRDLLAWVGSGGRLVIIDRFPDIKLLPPNGNWNVYVYPQGIPQNLKTDDQAEMTRDVKPVAPSQPTILTKNVDTIFPSRFAGKIILNWKPPAEKKKEVSEDYNRVYREQSEDPPPGVAEDENAPSSNSTNTNTSPPIIVRAPAKPYQGETDYEQAPTAPVIHFAKDGNPMVIDYPYGTGRIVLLSDPYIVSNSGIALADNLQLTLNLVAGRDGIIAFDEYHQGFGGHSNRLIAYFENTPVWFIVGQIILIVLALLWTAGKRFARPLSLPVPDRRSKLEYVASMAELQQSARAYDLAIENIYTRLRRVLARYGGLEANSRRDAIAARVAARGKLDPHQIETIMRQCEDAINGEKINGTQALSLIAKLRELETKLGLRLRSREVRQLKEK